MFARTFNADNEQRTLLMKAGWSELVCSIIYILLVRARHYIVFESYFLNIIPPTNLLNEGLKLGI